MSQQYPYSPNNTFHPKQIADAIALAAATQISKEQTDIITTRIITHLFPTLQFPIT